MDPYFAPFYNALAIGRQAAETKYNVGRQRELDAERQEQNALARQYQQMQMDQMQRGMETQDNTRNAMQNLLASQTTGGPIPYAEGQPYQQARNVIPNPSGPEMGRAILQNDGDLGTAMQFMQQSPPDPYDGLPADYGAFLQAYGMPNSPKARQMYQAERLAEKEAGASRINNRVGNEGPQIGTIPQGMQLTKTPEGSLRLEPIPGGPVEEERSQQGEKRLLAARDASRKSKIVTENIDKALKETGVLTAGFIGNVLSAVPGSPAYNLGQTIDTIRANIGFDTLQAMREASPTGGALGAVSERELAQLERVLASLDQAQSPKQLSENLRSIRQHYNNWKSAVMKAKPSDFSQPRQAQEQQATGEIEFLGFE